MSDEYSNLQLCPFTAAYRDKQITLLLSPRLFNGWTCCFHTEKGIILMLCFVILEILTIPSLFSTLACWLPEEAMPHLQQKLSACCQYQFSDALVVSQSWISKKVYTNHCLPAVLTKLNNEKPSSSICNDECIFKATTRCLLAIPISHISHAFKIRIPDVSYNSFLKLNLCIKLNIPSKAIRIKLRKQTKFDFQCK